MTVTERSFGLFRRTVQLPIAPDPEQVRAACDHGVLTVHVPRRRRQERRRRIEVRAAASGSQSVEAAGAEGPKLH